MRDGKAELAGCEARRGPRIQNGRVLPHPKLEGARLRYGARQEALAVAQSYGWRSALVASGPVANLAIEVDHKDTRQDDGHMSASNKAVELTAGSPSLAAAADCRRYVASLLRFGG